MGLGEDVARGGVRAGAREGEAPEPDRRGRRQREDAGLHHGHLPCVSYASPFLLYDRLRSADYTGVNIYDTFP